jgi:electron transfer flavoprotein alpha subunit
MTTLVIAEHDNTTTLIKGATLNTVTAAMPAAQATCTCWWPATTPVRRQCSRNRSQASPKCCTSTPRVWRMASPKTSPPRYWPSLATTATSCLPPQPPAKTLRPAWPPSSMSRRLSDITKVVSPDTFERPIYAGNAMATVQSIDAVRVITVRTTAFDPAAQSGRRQQLSR